MAAGNKLQHAYMNRHRNSHAHTLIHSHINTCGPWSFGYISRVAVLEGLEATEEVTVVFMTAHEDKLQLTTPVSGYRNALTNIRFT